MIYIIFANFFCLNFCIPVQTYGYYPKKKGMQKKIVIEENKKTVNIFFSINKIKYKYLSPFLNRLELTYILN